MHDFNDWMEDMAEQHIEALAEGTTTKPFTDWIEEISESTYQAQFDHIDYSNWVE